MSRTCLVVGEVAQAHDGSLGLAHAFIDAIADAGAHVVKFQTHIAAAESTPAEPWRVRFSLQDETRYEYWQRMEFTPEQWAGLKSHADQRGLLFVSSPFSLEAVELLRKIGVAAWKIASGETGNAAMFDRMVKTRLPVWLSTGMSDWAEIDKAVERLLRAECDLTLLQCTTAYTCPPEKVGLNLLDEFRARYGCSVGLSDHSGTIYPSLAAAVKGAALVEVHVTMSRQMFGPDVRASVTTTELHQLVEGVRWVEAMLAHSVDKDEAARELAPLRRMFTKSVVARHPLRAGDVLRLDDLTTKKPGTGLPPEHLPLLVGRRLKRNLDKDEMLVEDDLIEVLDS